MAQHTRTGKRLPPCDSFFVESQDEEDEGIFEARRQARQETQYNIAEEMSRMVSEEYQEDILDHMEHMEVRGFPSTFTHSWLINF